MCPRKKQFVNGINICVLSFKTSMNVLYLLTTVTRTQPAPTLMDLSCVLVTVDILEMELFAKVNKFCHYFKSS